jgi:hypothetical protein
MQIYACWKKKSVISEPLFERLDIPQGFFLQMIDTMAALAAF